MQEDAFQTWKGRLRESHILSLIKGNDYFVVYNDASYFRLGCVWMQRGKMIAYASQHLKSVEMNYLVHYLEFFAVVFELKLWCHYLYRMKCAL